MSLSLSLSRLCLFAAVACAQAAAGPVEFRFSLPADPAIKNPFAREVWADVVTPSGRTLELPAFYMGGNVFAVRARPIEAGAYHLGTVIETTAGHTKDGLVAKPESPASVEVAAAGRTRLPGVVLDPKDPHRFLRTDGHVFFPIGANLAWPEGDNPNFYSDSFAAFSKATLNWTRVWMVHWGQLNLDWVPDWAGASPAPGGIDPTVAQRWDDLLAAAEQNGVYVQVVLQHHGQYSTGADSNWKDNPWNAAHPGGFLKTPEEFFTNDTARLITALKYRYIIARWGWSPAVFAWELFNEVYWTDAVTHGHQDDVARWHDAMADLVHSVDVYHHLVTSSVGDPGNPSYAKLDFYQPHLYAVNMIDAAQRFKTPVALLTKPIFYGEEGDDHLVIDEAARKTGLALVPPAWAALMGQGMLPAQPWEGAKLLADGRAGELGALHRFAVISHFLEHRNAEPFSAVVETAGSVPLQITAGQEWEKGAVAEVTVPTDGRDAPQLANVPGILVGAPGSSPDGVPSHASYRFDLPKAATVRVSVASVGTGGGSLRVKLDGRVVLDKAWTGKDSGLPGEFPFEAAAGEHVLSVENPNGPDWVKVPEIDLGLEIPVLASTGRRDDSFVALWLWRRDGLFAAKELAPVGGTLNLDNLPAGTWTVTWWDTRVGKPSQPIVVQHAGGTLKVPVPPIARSAAVVLARKP